MIKLRQVTGININIKLFLISLRETTAMTIESKLIKNNFILILIPVTCLSFTISI